MMENESQNKQDVYYWFDDMGRACVDLYAKALNILDGSNPDYWKYDIIQLRSAYVYQAKLVSHDRLEVSSQHSPVRNLTPKTIYSVYFDLKLMHNAKGFKNPVMFELNDQNGTINRFPLQLAPGEIQVFVGKFVSTPNFHNVRAKMYQFNAQDKSGLIIRRVRIMHENSRIAHQGGGIGRGQGGWKGRGRGRLQGNNFEGGFRWQNKGGHGSGSGGERRWKDDEKSDDDEFCYLGGYGSGSGGERRWKDDEKSDDAVFSVFLGGHGSGSGGERRWKDDEKSDDAVFSRQARIYVKDGGEVTIPSLRERYM